MAYLTISMNELVSLIVKNAEYDRKRISEINVINNGQIEFNINVTKFLPKIKIVLVYNRYENGKMYFDFISKSSIKLLLGIISEFNNDHEDNFLVIERKSVVLYANDYLESKFEGVKFHEMSVSGEQVYIHAEIK